MAAAAAHSRGMNGGNGYTNGGGGVPLPPDGMYHVDNGDSLVSDKVSSSSNGSSSMMTNGQQQQHIVASQQQQLRRQLSPSTCV